jgi:hypothetical protein
MDTLLGYLEVTLINFAPDKITSCLNTGHAGSAGTHEGVKDGVCLRKFSASSHQ